MKYLLDTHILLRWVENGPHLSREQRRALRRVTPEEPVLVSDITLWEIACLVELGRIRLRLPLRDWLDHAVAPPLVERVGISPAIAAEVAALPTTLHRDPADRILIATARVHGAILVTQDQRILGSDLVPTLG